MANTNNKENDFDYQGFLLKVTRWKDLWFFQKSEVLYHMTYVFCERFFNRVKDRTVDQMVQSARSGKQNIVEGSEDGKTSTAMEIQLINIARSSISELRQDYEDFIISRHLKVWDLNHIRYQPMQDFTKTHNKLHEYEPYFHKWTAEEMCNIALTLCYQVDTMMNRYIKRLEQKFIIEGGIKERMHKSRTGYRKEQDKKCEELKEMIPLLQKQLNDAIKEADSWKSAYNDLKNRALKTYYNQQEVIQSLKEELKKHKNNDNLL